MRIQCQQQRKDQRKDKQRILLLVAMAPIFVLYFNRTNFESLKCEIGGQKDEIGV